MEKLVIRFMGEWYIQDGFTDLRSHTGDHIDNEPKFVKATIEEMKKCSGDIHYMKLKSGCTLEEIGFTAPRISETAYGDKIRFYGINTPEERKEREKPLIDVTKLFAEYYKLAAAERCFGLTKIMQTWSFAISEQ